MTVVKQTTLPGINSCDVSAVLHFLFVASVVENVRM